jgi:2-polyprenyl-3-methyl-5-hydroxy-6-metoxy-1,4-benzoquinol methylase
MKLYPDWRILELVEEYTHSSKHPDLVQYRE